MSDFAFSEFLKSKNWWKRGLWRTHQRANGAFGFENLRTPFLEALVLQRFPFDVEEGVRKENVKRSRSGVGICAGE